VSLGSQVIQVREFCEGSGEGDVLGHGLRQDLSPLLRDLDGTPRAHVGGAEAECRERRNSFAEDVLPNPLVNIYRHHLALQHRQHPRPHRVVGWLDEHGHHEVDGVFDADVLMLVGVGHGVDKAESGLSLAFVVVVVIIFFCKVKGFFLLLSSALLIFLRTPIKWSRERQRERERERQSER